MDESKILDIVKATEQKLEPLRKRMDADMKLYYLERFVLSDSKGKPVPDADHVTLNDPRTYADRVINVLGSAKRRFRVQGPTEVETAVEGFLRELYEVNDEVLDAQAMEELEFTLDFYATLRGWVMARVLLLRHGGHIVPEIAPIDPRFATWIPGRYGIDLASYRVSMSPDLVAEELGYQAKGDKDVEVLYVWTPELYKAYVDETEVRSTPHGLEHCPIVVVPTPTHPPSLLTKDEQAIKYRGESIYAANRQTYEKLNDFASVWATINKMTFMSPIGFVSEAGRKITQRPYGIGVVVNLQEGEKFVEIPTKELSQSAQVLFGQLFAGAQRGSLPNVDFGELSFELSAVAISKLTETRNVVFQPRLKAKSRLLRQAGQMALRQYTGTMYDVDELDEFLPGLLSEKDHLNEPCRINVDYHAVSPEQNVANYTIAQAAKVVGVSDRTILSEILMIEDPELEIRMRERENAEREIPEVRLYHYATALLEEYERTKNDNLQVEAQLVANHLGMVIQGNQIQPGAAGAKTEPPPNAASQPTPGLRMPGMPGGDVAQVERSKMRMMGVQEEDRGERAAGREVTG